MGRPIVIFEDEFVHLLNPLTLNRPVFDLLCGIRMLWQKIGDSYPTVEPGFWVRDFLVPLTREQKGGDRVNQFSGSRTLFLNARVLWNQLLARQISVEGQDHLYVCGETLVAARLSGENISKFNPTQRNCLAALAHVPRTDVQTRVVKYFWDLVNENAREIELDYAEMGLKGEKAGKMYEGVHLLNPDRITIGERTLIKPGVVIDAEKGPVFIDRGVTIMPLSAIEGPCYIGKNSIVKIGSKIYDGTSIGEVCKVGGEVTESILLSYTNKQHDGFLGHAYLGQWVNIGADTNNSDLKNDYGIITCIVNGDLVVTGCQFVGMVMGDYSRTGINTMFNTGTVVGIGCNIFGIGFPPKYMPSFTWGGAEAMVEYRFDKCLEAIQQMMRRRQKVMGAEEENLLRWLYDQTEEDREKARIMNRMKSG